MTALSSIVKAFTSGVQGYQKQNGSDGVTSNTVFSLSTAYAVGSGTLLVFVNGQKAEAVTSATDTTEYEETNAYTITFGASLLDSDVVETYIVGQYDLDQDTFDNMLTSSGVTGSFKNKIINGNFNIWQRGTSFSTLSGYSADRWKCASGSNGTVDRTAFTVGQTDVPNEPTYYMEIDKTGTGDYLYLSVVMEDVRTLAGKNVTLSFYAKDVGARTGYVRIYQNFGSGGSSLTLCGNNELVLSSSWQKFTFNYTMPSVSGKTFGTGHHIYVAFVPYGATAATTGTFDLAQVQLEEGLVATQFESRSLSQEIAMCKRYYEKSYGINVAPATATYSGALGMRVPTTNLNVYGLVGLFTVNKRTTPTIVLYSPVNGTSGYVRNASTTTDITGSAITPNETCWFYTTIGTAPTAGDAIIFHYTADADF